MSLHYYNEHDAYRAAVLRERMDEGLLPKGVVDERDIETVPDEDFLGYTQIHLFAGIGGFPLGLRLAGFSEQRRIVSGGFPCQDISNAGKRAGITGSRSRLWREMVRCVRVVRPELVFVENVAALLGRGMGVVLGDLAEIGYDANGDCVSAADVGAPHLRRRIWIVAYDAERGTGTIPARSRDEGEGTRDVDGDREDVANAAQRGFAVRGESSQLGGLTECSGETLADATGRGTRTQRRKQLAESGDGKRDVADAATVHAQGRNGGSGQRESGRSSRWPVEPNVGRVAHGIPKRVDRLAALGDAIVPQCAAEAIKRLVP